MGIVVKVVTTAAALWVATLIVPGITVGDEDTVTRVLTLLAVAVIFGIVNAVLKPIIRTIGCALYVLTLGLISLVVNGLLFLLVDFIAGELDLAFNVENFWPAAVVGALVVSVVSFLLNLLIPDGDD